MWEFRVYLNTIKSKMEKKFVSGDAKIIISELINNKQKTTRPIANIFNISNLLLF